jgi:hypothetical protein
MISAIATIAYFTAGIYAQCGARDLLMCYNFAASASWQACATAGFLKDPIIVACMNETGLSGIYSN